MPHSPGPPPPRLCLLARRSGQTGFGFNLQAEQGRAGQFVGCVEAGSAAARAGLRPGDRLLEVNGVNVSRESHRQVVNCSNDITD